MDNIYLQGAVILALVVLTVGTGLFLLNRRTKRNIEATRGSGASRPATTTSTITRSNTGAGNGGSNSSSVARDKAKKKAARKRASDSRRRNRR